MTVKGKQLRGEASAEAMTVLKALKVKTGLNQPQIISGIIEGIDVELGMLLLAPYVERMMKGEDINAALHSDQELRWRVEEARRDIKERLIRDLETMKPEVILQIRKLMEK